MTTDDWLFAAGMGFLVLGVLAAFTIWIILNLVPADGDVWDWRKHKQMKIRGVIHALAYDDLTEDEREEQTWRLHSLIYEYRTQS